MPTNGFPADFLWGAATAAYQIEGATSEDGRGQSIWDTFAAAPGKIRDGDSAEVACDHYQRWPEDVEIAASLGLGAYRMSTSWARLQPAGRGELNPKGVAYYRQLLEALRARGIRPFVTLYHWDLPQELEEAGGWPVRDTAFRFADYAEQTVAALGDLVDDWVTINEAWCASFLGYVHGSHAPGGTDLRAGLRAAHHLNLAHGLAVQAARARRPGLRVGPALLITDVEPASDRDEDVAAAGRVDGSANRLFLDPVLTGAYPADVLEHYGPTGAFEAVSGGDLAVIATPVDFLGVNHYHHDRVIADPDDPYLGARTVPPPPPVTSFGWAVRPESLRRVLTRIHDDYPRLPLYITESGASFDDRVNAAGGVPDQQRIDYLNGYIRATGEAIRRGVDVRGYFVWSLLDNFEWGEGYSKRFGLVHVDYTTLRRTLKQSAHWYRQLIASGGPPS